MRKLHLLIVLTILLSAVAWLYFHLQGAREPPRFRFARVERGPIVSTISSSGTLNAVITVQVGSQVSGQIKELLADFNSEVRAGQVIARIDPENFEARVRHAEAELEVARANVAIQRATVARARAELENAQAALAAAQAQLNKASVAAIDTKRDLERKQVLRRREVISESDLEKTMVAHDQASAQLNTARAELRAQASLVKSREAMLRMAEEQVAHAVAQVKQREASLHQSEVDLGHTIIRSPVEGVVIERSIDIGQTVAASLQAPTLFTIAQDLREMQVDTDIDEADIGRIQVGQRATFTVDAFPGKEFIGRVEQIRKAPHTLQNVVTYTVVVSAQNSDLRLLPGMTANVKIVVDERADVLKVPNAALRFRPADASTPQTKNVGQSAAGTRFGSGTQTTPERVNRLTEALNLDEAQQAQIRALLAEAREKIADLRRRGASPAEIRTEVEHLREAGAEAIASILTPEQRKKFEQMRPARRFNPAQSGRVWVRGPDGKASPVDVVAGISDGTSTEIIRGDLHPGQEVIVGSIHPLRRPSNRGKRFGL